MERMRIALVEDEPKLRSTLKEGLESEGYAVEVFPNGEAFEKAVFQEGERFDLLALDLMLPNKSGLEICTDVRGKGFTFPILVLTARSAVNDKVELFDAGADDFMTKPFSFEELLARFRALLRRPQELKRERLSIKDIVLDANTRTITRAGKPVPLTSTEFDLFQLLLERRGQVVSREKISTYLWGEEPGGGNVVDVHMSNLRKKVSGNNDQEIIRTVRGAGYLVQE